MNDLENAVILKGDGSYPKAILKGHCCSCGTGLFVGDEAYQDKISGDLKCENCKDKYVIIGED
jgi:hypothetical protein